MFPVKKIDKSLWTRNFTIITIGSFVSYFGNSAVWFLLGLWVYGLSGSVFLYGLYQAMSYFSRILIPLVAGKALDKVSRKKVIYSLDFISAGLYFLLAIYLRFFSLGYPLFIVVSVILGAIDCIYSVAFNSLYPSLVEKEKLEKAYSLHTILATTSGISIPIAMVIDEYFNSSITLLCASAVFLIAATFETTMKVEEQQTEEMLPERQGFKESVASFKRDFLYFYKQKGVFLYTAFPVLHFVLITRVFYTVLLPFCNEVYQNGHLWYMIIGGFASAGTFIGGYILLKIKIKPEHKSPVYISFYLLASSLIALIPFLPSVGRVVCAYLSSAVYMIAETLGSAAVVRHIDDGHIGRYNGLTSSVRNFGNMISTILAGLFADLIGIPPLIVASCILFLAVFVVLYSGNHKELKAFLSDDTIEPEKKDGP